MVPPQNYSQTETFPLRMCSRLLVLIIGENLARFRENCSVLLNPYFGQLISILLSPKFGWSYGIVSCSTDWFEEEMCIYN